MKPLLVKKPWGFEYFILTGDVSVSVLHMKTGEETSLHFHRKKDAIFTLVKGRVDLAIETITHGRKVFELPLLQPHRVVHGILHQEMAREDSIMVVFEQPGGIQDLVRKTDKYGRPQGYEVDEVTSVEEIIGCQIEK